ncbi:MAG: archaeal flagellar protein FlaF [Euryarchaeota archaeon]|nr:archaeal flagellar protein FlaF [Euryarchaeota archaeon]
MANGLSNSVIEMQENKNEILKTEIEVRDVRNISIDGADFLVSLQNTGSTKIGDFTYMDIIVAYQNESDTMKTVWVPYQEVGVLSENSWTKMGIIPDLINPGVFDPGEEMELKVRLNASDPPGDSSINWFLVAAPNGVKASWYSMDDLSI